MAVDWYLRIDGDVAGPFRPRELRAMARAGKIPPHAYLRRTVEGKWTRLERVTGLFVPSAARKLRATGSQPEWAAADVPEFRLDPEPAPVRAAESQTAFNVADLLDAPVAHVASGSDEPIGPLEPFGVGRSTPRQRRPSAARPRGGPWQSAAAGLISTLLTLASVYVSFLEARQRHAVEQRARSQMQSSRQPMPSPFALPRN